MPPQTEEMDALRRLMTPDASPALTVLRAITADKETFTLKHESMAAPPMPPPPEIVRAGKRVHRIHTLTGLLAYIGRLDMPTEEKPVAFYTEDGVTLVLDEVAKEEKETIVCTLARSNEFVLWEALLGSQLSQVVLVNFLRAHTGALNTADHTKDQAEALIGIYAALRGVLVHDADEFLDQQMRSAKFTVKHRRGGKEVQTDVEDVPTEFMVAMKILPDDEGPTFFRVLVRMSGGPGAEIIFHLEIENLGEIIDRHIDDRLEAFAEKAEFLCLRGEYQEEPWKEPQLAASVKALMKAQAELISAMHGGRD